MNSRTDEESKGISEDGERRDRKPELTGGRSRNRAERMEIGGVCAANVLPCQPKLNVSCNYWQFRVPLI